MFQGGSLMAATRSTNNPVRIAIVGLGRAGGLGSWQMHINELKGREGKFRIVAACDIIKERRQAMVSAFKCQSYARIEDLVQDPDIELVDIATRSVDHTSHAITALKAGKHVFLEKPIAVNYNEARKLMAQAKRSRGTLYIRHNRRFEPGFQHIMEIMASGLLGEIYEIKLRRHSYQRRCDWQTIRKFGGGQLLNWGPHIIDHGLRMLESPLAGIWSDLKRVAAVGDAEDHLKIILKGKNGRIVDLEISGGVALPEPEYLVFGTKGSLTCDEKEIKLRYLDPKVKLPPRKALSGTPGTRGADAPQDNLTWISKTTPVSPASKLDLNSIWDALYESIRNGKAFPIKPGEALEVMRVVSEARKGSRF